MSSSVNRENNQQEYLAEDEIDLRELFHTIWQNKFKIIILSFIVVSITLFYVLKTPNSYTSEVVLSPKGQDKGMNLGGLGSLASLAGVSIGGQGSSNDPFSLMQTTLNDYAFNAYMIKKYHLSDKINQPANLVYPFGLDFSSQQEEVEEVSEEEMIFNTIKKLKSILSISSDKKTGLITLSAVFGDRFFAKELVDIYLTEMIEKIKVQDMKEIEKQIEYYQKELSTTYDVSLKEQLSKSISALMQKRVFSQANDYYIVSKLIDSRIAFVKEKTKPKRALILLVSLVTSLILGVFLVFFIEFIKNSKMMRQRYSFILYSLVSASALCASSSTFGGSSGIIETPNARILSDSTAKFSAGRDKPFSYYGVSVAPLPFLETNLHVTKKDNVKDKSFGFKLLLQKEGKIKPSVVFGANDIWGSGAYTSKYITMGKEIGYFDFTIGYAKGRLAGRPIENKAGVDNNSFDNSAFSFLKDMNWRDGSFFGSFLFKAHKDFDILAEYSPVDYKKESIESKSKFNFGINYRLTPNNTFKLSVTRGNSVAFAYNYQLSFSDIDTKHSNNIINIETAATQQNYITAFELKDKRATLESVGDVISKMDATAPKESTTLYAVLKENELPIKTFKVNKEEYRAFQNEQLSPSYMQEALVISNDTRELKHDLKSYKVNAQKFSFTFKPTLENFAGSKQSYETRLLLGANLFYNPFAGMFMETELAYPIVNTLDESSNGTIVDYYSVKKTQLNRLSVGYIFDTPWQSLSKVEVGYFEPVYFGADLEWYRSFLNDKIGLGIEYQYIYKRDVDDMFEWHKKIHSDAKLLNVNLLLDPKYDLHAIVQAGEFLAGDKGAKLEVFRNYKAFSIGGFITATENDYVESGIYFKAPLDFSSWKNMKTVFAYRVSTLPNDAAESVKSSQSLYRMNSDINNQVMKAHIEEFK